MKESASREGPPNFPQWMGWAALAALAVVVFMGKGYETALPPNDSAFHALVSMNMTEKGPIPLLPVPRVHNYNGETIGGFNDHPFTLFYINGWLMRWLGPSSWSVRLLPGLFAVGSVLLTGVLGILLSSPIFGYLAALFLLFTPEYIKWGATFHLDHGMIFFILLSFILWMKGRWISSGIAAGIGTIIKTPVALLVIPVSFLVLFFERKSNKAFFTKDLPKWFQQVLAALVIVVTFWGLTAYLGGIEIVKDYWERQVMGTAVGGRNFDNSIDYLLFFKYALKRFAPWILFWIAAWVVTFRKNKWTERSVTLPLISSAVLCLAITPLRFKYEYYFLPALPFLALFSANSLESYFRALEKRLYPIVTCLALGLMALILVVPIPFAPEMFPALRKFNPFIQSFGNCTDKVLFIPGGQPYAASHEYWIEISFYTGRSVMDGSCPEASQRASDPAVKWIIASNENVEACLSQDIRDRFKNRVKFGNFQLLSTYSLANAAGAFDLTPLERELHPVTDCRPVDFPRDRYHAY